MSFIDIAAPVENQSMVPAIVQIVNEGPTTFNMRYGPTKRLVLQPGEAITLNEEVAWQFCGRWWSVDSEKNKERRDEYARLRTLYGAYEDDIMWEQNRPHLAVYTPTGQRITTVIDDPEGRNGQTYTQLGKEQSLEAQLASMQDMVLGLQAQINGKRVDDINDAQPTIPVDAPVRTAPPFNPAQPIQIPTAEVAGHQVPVAPPAVVIPDDNLPDESVVGSRLPVIGTVVFDPSEETVEEDAPPAIPHGPVVQPTPTGGGRVSG